jgi:hypothetical protein
MKISLGQIFFYGFIVGCLVGVIVLKHIIQL